MLSGGWKEFTFFDVTPVRDPSPPDALLFADPSIVSIVSSSSGSVFMLTRSGTVKEFSEDMQLKRSFTIFSNNEDRVPDYIYAVPNSSLLLTASSKLGGPVEIKVWNITNSEGNETESEGVKLHAQTFLYNKTNTFPPTAFVVAPDLSVTVVGFADGSVVALRGDLMHDRGTKQRQIHMASTSITGLHFTDDLSQVFVSSLTQIVVVSTTTSKSLVVLDKSRGAALLCTAGNLGSEFVVARDSDIVCYNRHHRGSSFELVFPKKEIFLHSSGDFLVVVGSFQPENRGLLTAESTRVIIVDLINHLVAFNQTLGNGGVSTIFEAWGRLNIVGLNGIMYVLREKSWRAQIELLKQRNLYQVAIEMIRRRHKRDDVDKSKEGEYLEELLHQDYADYLFEKNDIDASLKEYISAINLGQTSRAVRRFKDSQYAPTLLAYLSALFERGKSTPEHVTLQIICYTKLGGKVAELQQLLAKAVESMPNFNFEKAINVLVETHSHEYAELAARLAAKYPDPDRCVQIRLRQLNDVKGALDYIQTISVADALRILIQNSRLMLNKLPVETTGVLITLFTGKFRPRSNNPGSEKIAQYDINEGEKDERVKGSENGAPLLQSYQAFISFLSSTNYLGSNIVSAETLEQDVGEPSYLPPRPRLIFPSFIGHDNEFVIFLEACLQAAPHFKSSSKDLNDIASTLFETYLLVGAKQRASSLVNEHFALLYPVSVLSTSESYGLELSSEQQHLLGISYTDIFREKLRNGDVESAFSLLLDHKDPELARLAPKLMAQSRPMIETLNNDQLLALLNEAVHTGNMTHVELIAELSHSPYLTVGDLRPFMKEFFAVSTEQIRRQDKLANSYIAEIDDKRNQNQNSGDDVMIVNYGDCAQCTLPLELPAVHYSCQHSYHEACLSDGLTDCPRCLPELENAENLRQQAEEAAANESYFFEEMSKRDKQKVLWDFISRGALSKVN